MRWGGGVWWRESGTGGVPREGGDLGISSHLEGKSNASNAWFAYSAGFPFKGGGGVWENGKMMAEDTQRI